MSLPNIMLFGFGDAGGLTQQSLEQAYASGIQARYVSLGGSFADLTRPHPALWQSISETLAAHLEDETIVIWAQNALIIWDKLERAFAINHQPDFLWPLSLGLENGVLSLPESDLFLAVGGFEISLFGFEKLGSFSHAVRARALSKLLDVSDLSSLTLGGYLMQSWDNFESVKAPDTWLIAGDESLSFTTILPHVETHASHFKGRHQQWLMSREALEAHTRNTLAAADFTKSNLDIMETRLPHMMTTMPYYGFWPFKHFLQPVTGYHPAVAADIWHGSYKKQAMDFWRGLFCVGSYTKVIDMNDDGHIFGLTFVAMNQKFHGVFHCPNMQCGIWALGTLEVNKFGTRAAIDFGPPQSSEGAIIVTSVSRIPTHLWGKADMFIILDDESSLPLPLPADYVAMGGDHDKMNIRPIDLFAFDNLSVIMVIRKDRMSQILENAK